MAEQKAPFEGQLFPTLHLLGFKGSTGFPFAFAFSASLFSQKEVMSSTGTLLLFDSMHKSKVVYHFVKLALSTHSVFSLLRAIDIFNHEKKRTNIRRSNISKRYILCYHLI
jgi:hypothetical protein